MIRITKYNEIFSCIDTDSYTKTKLVYLFNIQEPSYYFNPRYKMGLWDGRRKLYSGGNFIYNGLIPFVHKFAESKNIEIKDETEYNTYSLDNNKPIINFLDLIH